MTLNEANRARDEYMSAPLGDLQSQTTATIALFTLVKELSAQLEFFAGKMYQLMGEMKSVDADLNKHAHDLRALQFELDDHRRNIEALERQVRS